MMINMRTTTRRLQATVRDANTRNAKLKPPKSRSWQPRGLLVVVIKKEEKEDNYQHEDRN
jgi:hypothetical protein